MVPYKVRVHIEIVPAGEPGGPDHDAASPVAHAAAGNDGEAVAAGLTGQAGLGEPSAARTRWLKKACCPTRRGGQMSGDSFLHSRSVLKPPGPKNVKRNCGRPGTLAQTTRPKAA